MPRIDKGYAKRWIRLNWWRAVYAASWAIAGIVIRAAVASTRPESWYMGSEIVPMALCWVMAARVAFGERSALKRGKAKKK